MPDAITPAPATPTAAPCAPCVPWSAIEASVRDWVRAPASAPCAPTSDEIARIQRANRGGFAPWHYARLDAEAAADERAA